jgi:hypothetical protein
MTFELVDNWRNLITLLIIKFFRPLRVARLFGLEVFYRPVDFVGTRDAADTTLLVKWVLFLEIFKLLEKPFQLWTLTILALLFDIGK